MFAGIDICGYIAQILLNIYRYTPGGTQVMNYVCGIYFCDLKIVANFAK